jgi:hypothetical protein
MPEIKVKLSPRYVVTAATELLAGCLERDPVICQVMPSHFRVYMCWPFQREVHAVFAGHADRPGRDMDV